MANRLEEDIERTGAVARGARVLPALNDPVPSRGLSLAECLMSGLAVFGLK